MQYRDLLSRLIRGENLSADESSAALDGILSGEWSEARLGAFLAALAAKGETVNEIVGAARAMRRKASRLQSLGGVVLDTCGTGGDGAGTFNISTVTALVAAGAGVKVAKHGNRSVSSRCGSADVLEALGLRLDGHIEIMEHALNEIGIAFLFAPRFHAAMRHAMPVRKQLGVRNIFNLLGPLTNPAGAGCQLLGVYAPELTEMFAAALRDLGSRHSLVVHGREGLDEISISGPTRVTELKGSELRTYDIEPEQFGFDSAPAESLAGGDPAFNARIVRAILEGEQGPRRDIVLLNAAAALVAADRVTNFTAGLEAAARSIDDGAAGARLDALIAFTAENG